MRPIRTVSVFPTLLTLGNLVCGFFAIVVAARVDRPPEDLSLLTAAQAFADATDLMLAAWLIFLGMVFDGLDGYVARLSRSASDFGAELDSLCDLVTFGVAPGFLLVKMCPEFTHLHSRAVWVIAAAYAACAALRLARFNVELADDEEHLEFKGLPSPAAAAAIASFAILFHTLRNPATTFQYASQVDSLLQTALPFFGVLLALLMVSRIPYPHVVNQIFRGQRSFGHVVAVLFALVAVMIVRGYAIPIVCCGFVFYGPIHYLWERLVVHRRREEEALF